MPQQTTDNVARIQQLLERHPDWTWTKPPRTGFDHIVEYALNGERAKIAHHDLGKLADYLDVVDRAKTAGRIPAPRAGRT